MDYEKAYKAVLETATQWIKDGCTDKEKICLENVFPELRESEDERIRRAIVETIKQCPYDFLNPKNRDKMLAYLEKQKEQIPYTDFVIKPHKGDDNNPYDMGVSEAQEYATKRGFGVPFIDGEVYVDERHIIQTVGNIIRWADEHPKEQKPGEFNDNDDQLIGFIFDLLNDLVWRKDWAMSKEECLERLKSLRPPLKDKEMKLKILKYLSTRCSSLEFEEVEDYLNNLRPSWRPSEEQMEALQVVVDEHWDVDGDALYSLYTDLKELM